MLRLEVFEVEKVKSKKGDAEWEECWTCGAAACTKDECDLAACDYIMRQVMGGTRWKKQRLVEVEVEEEEEDDILDLLPQHQKQLLRQREEEEEEQRLEEEQEKKRLEELEEVRWTS
jgi:hypothetical protein